MLVFVFMMEMASKGKNDRNSACRSGAQKSQKFSVTSTGVASWVLLGWIMPTWRGMDCGRDSFFLFALCFVFLVSLVSVLDFVFMIEMGSKVNNDRNSACRSDAHILGDFECRGLLGPPGLDHGFLVGVRVGGENEQP